MTVCCGVVCYQVEVCASGSSLVHRSLTECGSKMSHPHCVYINNRCRCQSVTQQYLKRCLINNANNYMYMFRPIATTIRVSFKSMVVVLIGLVWLYHDGEISTSVMFPIVKGHGGGVSVMCVILGCIGQVFCSLLSYVSLQLLSSCMRIQLN
jgi:hypothetical protein